MSSSILTAARNGWANGSLLIVGGAIATVASGSMLYKMEIDDGLKRGVDSSITDEATGGRGISSLSSYNELTQDPVLYDATVTHALGMMFDGPVALKNLKQGETVGVLEEKVGPEKRYSRARSFKKGKPLSEGWYPGEFLAKVQDLPIK